MAQLITSALIYFLYFHLQAPNYQRFCPRSDPKRLHRLFLFCHRATACLFCFFFLFFATQNTSLTTCTAELKAEKLAKSARRGTIVQLLVSPLSLSICVCVCVCVSLSLSGDCNPPETFYHIVPPIHQIMFANDDFN